MGKMPRKERQFQGIMLQYLNELIKKKYKNIFSAEVIQEEGYADILIKGKTKEKFLILIELKDPEENIYSDDLLARELRRVHKLNRRSNFNIQVLVFYNLKEGYLTTPDGKYEWNFKLDIVEYDIEKAKRGLTLQHIKDKILDFLEKVLDISLSIIENKPVIEKKTPRAPHFIAKISELLEQYAYRLNSVVYEKFLSNRDFRSKVSKWLTDNLWNAPSSEEEMYNVTYLSLLHLFISIMFYYLLKEKVSRGDLPEINVEDVDDYESLYERLYSYYFEPAQRKYNFEIIFRKKDDAINIIPFVGKAIIEFVKETVNLIREYNLAELDYDVLGKIFEGIIKEEERHKLGQYYTDFEVVDLILSFVTRDGNEKILDPSCGSGTFLIRAYSKKQALTNKGHREILQDLYGIDISPYATYLATLNLIIRNLSIPAVPYIVKSDFFDVKPGNKFKIVIYKENRFEPIEVIFKQFDVVVGNPPYTRQEEMEDIFEGEKEKAHNLVYQEWKIKTDKRSSIYAYFFFHAGKFVKEKGYLGFVTSNSYLSTKFGDKLKEWMLNHFKIIAIIESKVERWFKDAAINTCITILQRETNPEERKNNIVRFVYLKKKLKEIKEKFGNYDNFVKFILSITDIYEDDYIKVVPVKQSELNPEEKWQKYLKLPKIIWDEILIKRKDMFIELGEICEIKRGIRTGANKFFYVEDVTDNLTDADLVRVRNRRGLNSIEEVKRNKLRITKGLKDTLWIIEEEFLEPIIKGPEELIKYEENVKKTKYKLLLVNRSKEKLRGTFALKYIEFGEKELDKSGEWFIIKNPYKAFILLAEAIHDRFLVVKLSEQRTYDQRLIGIRDSHELLPPILASSLSLLLIELGGRTNLGEGALDLPAEFYKKLIILNPAKIGGNTQQKILNAWEKMKNRNILSIFDELGTRDPNKVDLNKVQRDRLELDLAILEALGITDKNEQEKLLKAIYSTLIDLVKSRIERAQSVIADNKKKNKKNNNIELLAEKIKSEILSRGRLPSDNVEFYKELKELVESYVIDKKTSEEVIKQVWKKIFGKRLTKKRINELEKKIKQNDLTKFFQKV